MPIFTSVLRAEIEIDAEPQDVWRVLAGLDAYPDWNPFIVSMSGDLRSGAILTIVVRDTTGKDRTFTPEVLVADPGRELRWLGRVSPGGIFDGEHSFRIEPVVPGKVRFVQDERFRGIAVPFAASWLRRHTLPQFEAMNHALARRVADA